MSRNVAEGIQYQGADETLVYTLTVTPAPDDVTTVTVYDLSDWSDVTATVMPAGSASYSDSVITLPPLTALTKNALYRVEVRYTSGSNTLEPYFLVRGER